MFGRPIPSRSMSDHNDAASAAMLHPSRSALL
jgi:hypothetical protein